MQTDLFFYVCENALMEITQEKARAFVRRAMEKTGLDATNLARQAKVSPSTLTRLLSGSAKTTLSAKTMLKISDVAGIPSPLSEDGAVLYRQVPLFGYVGAGEKIIPCHDAEAIDLVEAPAWADDGTSALVVKGDSMFPAYWDGDIVFFDANCRHTAEDCLFAESIVYLEDGEVYIKQVHPSGTDGKYILISYNAAPIMNVKIKWASPITFVDRRFRKNRK